MSEERDQGTDQTIADAPADNWVDRRAPPGWRPYFKLSRFDRPIGAWLLLWPGLWSLALAAGQPAAPSWRPLVAAGWPDPILLMLFFLGAFVMRGAGCTYNDIVDRNFDGLVERTALRPIPSGQVSVARAAAYMIAQALLGFFILLSFNPFAIWLGIASLGLVAIYPFMKRITYWPQLVLGLTFNWGALLGWAAVTGTLSWAPLALYLGGIFWTLGYDTIYAHQDKEDDLLIGVKSTAIKFGEARTKPWLYAFYAGTMISLAVSGMLAELGPLYFMGLAMATFMLTWQVRTLRPDLPGNCLIRFRANHPFGLVIFFAIALGHAV